MDDLQMADFDAYRPWAVSEAEIGAHLATVWPWLCLQFSKTWRHSGEWMGDGPNSPERAERQKIMALTGLGIILTPIFDGLMQIAQPINDYAVTNVVPIFSWWLVNLFG